MHNFSQFIRELVRLDHTFEKSTSSPHCDLIRQTMSAEHLHNKPAFCLVLSILHKTFAALNSGVLIARIAQTAFEYR